MSQIRETAAVRQKQLEEKQLRSRQRANYEHLLKRFRDGWWEQILKNIIFHPLSPPLHFSQSAELPGCCHSADIASGGCHLSRPYGNLYFQESHQVRPDCEMGSTKLSNSTVLPLQVSQESAAVCRELFLPDLSL